VEVAQIVFWPTGKHASPGMIALREVSITALTFAARKNRTSEKDPQPTVTPPFAAMEGNDVQVKYRDGEEQYEGSRRPKTRA